MSMKRISLSTSFVSEYYSHEYSNNTPNIVAISTAERLTFDLQLKLTSWIKHFFVQMFFSNNLSPTNYYLIFLCWQFHALGKQQCYKQQLQGFQSSFSRTESGVCFRKVRLGKCRKGTVKQKTQLVLLVLRYTCKIYMSISW